MTSHHPSAGVASSSPVDVTLTPDQVTSYRLLHRSNPEYLLHHQGYRHRGTPPTTQTVPFQRSSDNRLPHKPTLCQIAVFPGVPPGTAPRELAGSVVFSYPGAGQRAVGGVGGAVWSADNLH